MSFDVVLHFGGAGLAHVRVNDKVAIKKVSVLFPDTGDLKYPHEAHLTLLARNVDLASLGDLSYSVRSNSAGETEVHLPLTADVLGAASQLGFELQGGDARFRQDKSLESLLDARVCGVEGLDENDAAYALSIDVPPSTLGSEAPLDGIWKVRGQRILANNDRLWARIAGVGSMTLKSGERELAVLRPKESTEEKRKKKKKKKKKGKKTKRKEVHLAFSHLPIQYGSATEIHYKVLDLAVTHRLTRNADELDWPQQEMDGESARQSERKFTDPLPRCPFFRFTEKTTGLSDGKSA